MKAFEVLYEVDLDALKKRAQAALEPKDDTIAAWGKSADKSDPNYDQRRDPTYKGPDAYTSGNPIGQAQTGHHEMNKKFDSVVSAARIPEDIINAFTELPKEYGTHSIERMKLQKALIAYANKKYLGSDSDSLGVPELAQQILDKKQGQSNASAEPTK